MNNSIDVRSVQTIIYRCGTLERTKSMQSANYTQTVFPAQEAAKITLLVLKIRPTNGKKRSAREEIDPLLGKSSKRGTIRI